MEEEYKQSDKKKMSNEDTETDKSAEAKSVI
jgi:hypothetical protein